MKRPALLLGAASGLQIGKQLNLKFLDGLDATRQKDLRDQLLHCRGPHVGSYHNKVFKRFMYETGLPLAIFLTGEKIDCKIEVGRCHFVLDSWLTWENFCSNHPVAFCIGCRQEERPKLTAMFDELGFHLRVENSSW
jgi:hypothetical protein